jgi:type I restriction enzyme S subunit
MRSRTEVGDLIMNIVGPPLGKLAIIPSSLPHANFNQAAVLIRPLAFKDVLVKYLFYYLSQMSEINSIATRGSAGQVNISLTQSQNMRIALPPLNEQKRIVNQIELLWKYLDLADEETNNLKEASEKAKSKILGLAISGKLVAQDPVDEPAEVLLKRVNPNAVVSADTSHYALPSNWVWVKGKDLFLPMKSTTPKGDTFKYIDIDSIDNKNQCISAIKVLPIEKAPSRASRYTEKNNVLFSMVRPYLRNIALVTEDECIASTGFYVCRQRECLDHNYLYYLMTSRYVVDGLNMFMKGDNSPSINKGHIDEFDFPLPPLNEQKRIVAKVAELFAQIDTIQQSLE